MLTTREAFEHFSIQLQIALNENDRFFTGMIS